MHEASQAMLTRTMRTQCERLRPFRWRTIWEMGAFGIMNGVGECLRSEGAGVLGSGIWDLANDCFEWQRDCYGRPGIRCRDRENGSSDYGPLPWAPMAAAWAASLLVAAGRRCRGMRSLEHRGRPCFGGLGWRKHGSAGFYGRATSLIGSVPRMALVWCWCCGWAWRPTGIGAHSGVSPGGERCWRGYGYGYGYVFVESACHYPRARRGGERSLLCCLFSGSPHGVVLTGADNMGHAYSPD
jgi:hypothetical protein